MADVSTGPGRNGGFWNTPLRVAVAASALAVTATLGYVAVTWDEPRRPAMAALLLAGLAVTLLVGWLAPDRVTGRGRGRTAVYAWSLPTIAFTTALAGLDGGTTSPLQALYLLALLHASVAARRDVAVVTGLTIAAYVLLGLVGRTGLPAEPLGFIATFFAVVAFASSELVRNVRRRQEQWRELPEQLRQTTERLDLVLASVNEAVLALDAEGRVVVANPASAELFGDEPADLVGRSAATLVGRSEPDHGGPCSGDEPAHDHPVHATIAGGQPRSETHGVGWHVDGSAFAAEYSVTPVDADADLGAVLTVRDVSGRQRVEAERDELASVVQASPDLALIGGVDGRMRWLNPAGRALLGIGADEDVTAYRIEDLFSEEEMARIYREDMPKVATHGDWEGEWVLQARDGTQIPVEVTQHVHLDERGRHSYVSGIMRDLRPRRAEEQKLRDSERRLAEAEVVAGLGSWEWELDRDVVWWSPGMYRLHGMEVGDRADRVDTWLATVHPDDRARAAQSVQQAAAACRDVDFTYRAQHRDGRELVIHARGELVTDERGRPGRMVGTLSDITGQHAAAVALRASEERARSIIATATDAYIEVDPGGRITEWNRRAEATFGWARDEALGREVRSLIVPPAHRARLDEGLAAYAATGEEPFGGERFELTARHRSGVEFPVEIAIWLIEGGSAPAFGSFVRDISERRAAERAKDEFVSVISHELRTPLTSLHGALKLLASGTVGDVDEGSRRMLDIAVSNADRLVALINDFLDIERLESGRTTLAVETCDAAGLAERAVELLRPLADEAQVALEVDVEAVTVTVDPHRIEQTLTNLLSNAVKFSPPEGTVRVAGRREGGWLTIRVTDEGRGIPPDKLESIFGRFQQVDASDTRRKGGTGLGLAICRTIVEQHGGDIRAQSEPGEGATFTVTLPAG